MSSFALPDLGEGLREAEIVNWHVGPGDHVVSGQPLVVVETDKAAVEIPSPQARRVARVIGEPGERIEIGTIIVEFTDEEVADAGTVVGMIPTGEREAPAAKDAARRRQRRQAPSVKATPAVRALARKHGIDLSFIAPSGEDGRVTAEDVKRAAAAGPVEPLRGVRRAMARRMERAEAEVVPATVTDQADVGAWANGTDPTIRLIRAIVAGCAAEPVLNAWFDSQAMGWRLHEFIDLGIAMDTPDGLFVPVLRDVGNRDAADLRRGLGAMKADVANRAVSAEDLRGQTITLSNFGTIGGRHAALVVVPPQVAIIGAGRIAPAVVVRDGQPATSRVLPLSLTFDHRAVNGGEAARFLATAVEDLQRSD